MRRLGRLERRMLMTGWGGVGGKAGGEAGAKRQLKYTPTTTITNAASTRRYDPRPR